MMVISALLFDNLILSHCAPCAHLCLLKSIMRIDCSKTDLIRSCGNFTSTMHRRRHVKGARTSLKQVMLRLKLELESRRPACVENYESFEHMSTWIMMRTRQHMC
ncbi:hypothetical protein EDB19DRAFT_18610 [Suillus lakei]|nr:hypothetical protein EDB19DRAFT_18610 [Suillus lakei]